MQSFLGGIQRDENEINSLLEQVNSWCENYEEGNLNVTNPVVFCLQGKTQQMFLQLKAYFCCFDFDGCEGSLFFAQAASTG